jgi:prepilin-type N-terminal cleavage/methylation domain-containing protein
MKKPAFTVVELLVVVTILAILVTFVTVDFRVARRQQSITLLTEQTLAMLQQAQREVASGKVDGEFWLCQGAFFAVDGLPEFAQAAYDGDLGECRDFESSLSGLSSASQVRTESIEVGGSALDEAWVFFIPPRGEFVFYDVNSQPYVGDAFVHFESTADEAFESGLEFSYLTKQFFISHEDRF